VASLTAVRMVGPSTRTEAPASGPPPAAVIVPCKVPVGPRGVISTAAKASTRPSPKTLLLAAVPPQERSAVSMAVWPSRRRVPAMSPTRVGAADHIRATTPDRCGVAMEVPLKLEYELPGTLLRTFTPGAEMLGLMMPPKAEAPRLEKLAMTLPMS
jgi:hypothetical protein